MELCRNGLQLICSAFSSTTSEANTSTLSFDYRDFSQLWCQKHTTTSEANTSTLSFDYRDFSQLWCQKHTREHTPSSSSNDRVSSLPDCWIRQLLVVVSLGSESDESRRRSFKFKLRCIPTTSLNTSSTSQVCLTRNFKF